ncbi:PREDICTED: taste receptor type 2 member 42-like [Hipposideros armiger]|uniref:Taste receptor type 2 n=1 Tax=Hipposideros armiger TaxID=186990 RepID=A0A8B7QM21_HIPAR|nr:PREDICTED: taste receptor type 2 member 42-like [Hipposideros armiger]
MPSGIEKIFLITTVAELTAGMLGNGFIVLVNCLDWVKSQKLSSADCILTCLAVSRIILLWITLFDSFVIMLWPNLYTIDKIPKFFAVFWALSNHLATWFATCLSVFYFFKIANFSYPCFTWLRWRVGRVLLVLQLGSLLSLSFSITLAGTLNDLWMEDYNMYKRNSTWSPLVSNALYLNNLIAYSFMYSVPFLLSLTSLLLLFLSLMRHTRNLQLTSSSRDFSTEAHRKAMKMVLSFLLLFMLHIFFTLLAGWIFQTLEKHLVSLLIMLTSTVFPSAHSFVLILGNGKLRQTGLGLLWHLSCHLKRAKPLAS